MLLAPPPFTSQPLFTSRAPPLQPPDRLYLTMYSAPPFLEISTTQSTFPARRLSRLSLPQPNPLKLSSVIDMSRSCLIRCPERRVKQLLGLPHRHPSPQLGAIQLPSRFRAREAFRVWPRPGHRMLPLTWLPRLRLRLRPRPARERASRSPMPLPMSITSRM